MAGVGNVGGGVLTAEIQDGGTKNLFFEHDWVGYTFGSMFIVIGLLLFLIYPKTAARARRYKAEQLKEFNIQKKRNATDYKTTGMYLPAWEKVKMWWPVLLGMTMVILGIAWLAGQTLFSM